MNNLSPEEFRPKAARIRKPAARKAGNHPVIRALPRRCAWVCFLALVLPPPGWAQRDWDGLEHVRWPLLDLVMLPDSAGVWIVVGPNPDARQWKSGSHLIDLHIDPVLAIQWATFSRGLIPSAGESSTHPLITVTPPLKGNRGSEFVMLARNQKKASDSERLIFVASDSGTKTHWKSFASAAEVDLLLAALERAALTSRARAYQLDASPASDPNPDTPVRVVYQPMPRYPARLALRGRVGRVWISYVVGSDGRAQEGSFRPLLSDDTLFTQAAIRALLDSRFKPALVNNQPVSKRVFQAILFKQR